MVLLTVLLSGGYTTDKTVSRRVHLVLVGEAGAEQRVDDHHVALLDGHHLGERLVGCLLDLDRLDGRVAAAAATARTGLADAVAGQVAGERHERRVGDHRLDAIVDRRAERGLDEAGNERVLLAQPTGKEKFAATRSCSSTTKSSTHF